MLMSINVRICLSLWVLLSLAFGKEALAQMSAGYSLATSTTFVAPGSTISVAWQAPSSHGARDWIGLFLASQPSAGNTVWDFKYVPGGTSGIMTFTVPTHIYPNHVYEFRYLLNNGYAKTATSNPIRGITAIQGSTGTPVTPPATTTPSPSPTSPPTTTPSNPSAPVTSRSATLSWTASSSSDVSAYKVYRSTRSSVYGAPIATLSHPTVKYLATGLQLNTTYYFIITAIDRSNNESPYSNEVSKSIY